MTTVPFVVLNRAGSTQKAARPSAVYSLFVEKGLDKLKTRAYYKITVRTANLFYRPIHGNMQVHIPGVL